VEKKQRIASSGCSMIGSPMMLNDVFSTTGTPVSAPSWTSSPWKRGWCRRSTV
jgi:hypothetical protein